MPEMTDQILERIKFLRKSRRRSIHDCATILGLSKETYHNIEKGTEPISLPELELLAIYLGEDPARLVNTDYEPDVNLAFLNEERRPHYQRLRNKMLNAMITLERENQGVSLEGLQEATDIPLDTLHAYENGTAAVPIDDLFKITSFLGIQTDALHEPLRNHAHDQEAEDTSTAWHPEFSAATTTDDATHVEPHSVILDALQRVPKQDQAFIAKYLLDKLRSM